MNFLPIEPCEFRRSQPGKGTYRDEGNEFVGRMVEQVLRLFRCQYCNWFINHSSLGDFRYRIFDAISSNQRIAEEHAQCAAVTVPAAWLQGKVFQPIIALTSADRGDRPLAKLSLEAAKPVTQIFAVAVPAPLSFLALKKRHNQFVQQAAFLDSFQMTTIEM